MYLYFKRLQTLSEKRKYNLLHLSDSYIYNAFNRLLGSSAFNPLRFYSVYLRVCSFAFVGVTFLKTQQISPMHNLNT